MTTELTEMKEEMRSFMKRIERKLTERHYQDDNTYRSEDSPNSENSDEKPRSAPN